MRAKNEYKFLAEAYSQVNEGFDDVGKRTVRDAARQGAVEVDPISRSSARRWADEGPRYQLSSVGGPHGEQGRVVGEFDTIDEVIDFIDLPEEYGREWTVDIRDNRAWSSEGFEDGLSHFGIGEIYDVVDTQSAVEDQEFNELENKRERARDRGREAEDKGDWDEWNRQENEREGAKDALREIEDPEDYWTPEGLEVGRRVTYETSKGNQSTGKVLEIGQDVVKIRDELAGEEKEILIKDILKVESELGEGPEVPPNHPLR